MTDPIQALLLKATGQPANNLPVSSRYHPVGTAEMDGPDGLPIVYLKRRFVPQPGHYSSVQQHTVQQGERPDTVTAQYLGDPEQFWQLADANGLMKPRELTEDTGKVLRIPQSAGISGF